MYFKLEKRVAHVTLLENENRNITALIIQYDDGSEETVTHDKITKESR